MASTPKFKEIRLKFWFKIRVDPDVYAEVRKLKLVVHVSGRVNVQHEDGTRTGLGQWLTKPPAGQIVVFRNENRKDFRRINLLVVPRAEALRHARRSQKQIVGGLKGVHRTKVGFQAMMRVGGKIRWLGTYKDPKTAALVYDAHTLAWYGPTVHLNYWRNEDGVLVPRPRKIRPRRHSLRGR